MSKLETISFSQSSLTGTIPTELARMTSLIYLSIWGIDTLTGSIPQLPASIERFYVYQCDISGPFPSIGQLTNLIDFEVDVNSVR